MDDKEEGASSSKIDKSDSSSPEPSIDVVEAVRRFFEAQLGFHRDCEALANIQQVLPTVDMKGLIQYWNSGGFKNIVTMVGAGISTSAGIPDFRSPGTGLYNNLQKYDLPYSKAIFEVDYFLKNPKPFLSLAKELYPGTFKPTPCHYFIRLLHERGLLLRHYTQNIDILERIAGIPDSKIVEAHGTFYTNHCLGCKMEYSMEWMKEKIFADVIPTCHDCNSLVKPDIVFFGENLPEKFYALPESDFQQCDLLIIMGTSLEVMPFASLIDLVDDKCVRLLINREEVGTSPMRSILGRGLHFDIPGNKRDVICLGDCDDGILHLAQELGLKEELDTLMATEHAKLDAMNTLPANVAIPTEIV